MNNKYQEALDNYSENVDYRDYSTKTVDIVNESYDTLQELVDQNKEYTLEECKKMWEENGYEWVKKYHIHIKLPLAEDEVIYNEIAINPKTKAYFKRYGLITYQEHNLITKTLKALEKEENHDYS